jgi:hypothetical protein
MPLLSIRRNDRTDQTTVPNLNSALANAGSGLLKLHDGF